LAEFYRQLFGWRLERAPGHDYWRIETGAAPAGGADGGLTYRPIAGTRGWVHYVHVASLDDAVAEAERLGAVVLRPRTAVPKTAWYTVLADPEGNVFAIYQADPAAFPPPGPDRGSG
jgi:predicted enzyme related to lactoylglutathione lyase